MIIRVVGDSAEHVAAAKNNLRDLAQGWGHEIGEDAAQTSEAAEAARNSDKVLDPVALTAMVLSIPSAALAVNDLADRIRKRRRAKELIDHAQQLAARHVTITLITRSGPLELASLVPDQILDQLGGEDPSPP